MTRAARVEAGGLTMSLSRFRKKRSTGDGSSAVNPEAEVAALRSKVGLDLGQTLFGAEIFADVAIVPSDHGRLLPLQDLRRMRTFVEQQSVLEPEPTPVGFA
jgi:hypothetical protein